jgi:hypothetical protein
MAPEQLYGQYGVRSDLYAVGATIAAVAAGVEAEHLPRRGHAIDLARILSPGRLRSVLASMLAEDPSQRPVSARAAVVRLRSRNGIVLAASSPVVRGRRVGPVLRRIGSGTVLIFAALVLIEPGILWVVVAVLAASLAFIALLILLLGALQSWSGDRRT